MDITFEDAETLGAKLDQLDLTEGERAFLMAIFATSAHADDEVEGFAYDLNPNDLSFKALSRKAFEGPKMGIMFETLRREPPTGR